ncbi:MAG: histidinol phosphate phosphatase domain-containing protein [Candidatus Omnitrophota bacterium]
MIDLHTHTLLSDGELLPTELARRAQDKGYKVIGITDHVDSSNIDFVISGIINACNDINGINPLGFHHRDSLKAGLQHNRDWKIRTIPGVEITHMPLELIKSTVKFVRSKGIKLVLAHGETIVEPVIKGTNKAALLSDINILTHPGLISLEDAKLAAARNIYLEITSRKGHSLTNGHVAKMAKLAGAKLVLNTDSHTPENLITKDFAEEILSGAGLDKKEIGRVFKNSEELVLTLIN